MSNQKLNQSLSELKSLKSAYEQLEKLLNEKRNEILAELQNNNLTSYKSDSGISCQIMDKEMISYTNETAIIDYLKNNDHQDLIKTVAITTSLNEILRDKTTNISEDLKDYFKQTTKSILVVK